MPAGREREGPLEMLSVYLTWGKERPGRGLDCWRGGEGERGGCGGRKGEIQGIFKCAIYNSAGGFVTHLVFILLLSALFLKEFPNCLSLYVGYGSMYMGYGSMYMGYGSMYMGYGSMYVGYGSMHLYLLYQLSPWQK